MHSPFVVTLPARDINVQYLALLIKGHWKHPPLSMLWRLALPAGAGKLLAAVEVCRAGHVAAASIPWHD